MMRISLTQVEYWACDLMFLGRHMREYSEFDVLLPCGSAVVEASSTMWEGSLYPIEMQALRAAVDKRISEFTAGRNCARAALVGLGLAPEAIPVGSGGAPVFPPGVSGSITHTKGYCAAAAILQGEFHSIGIDAEDNDALDEELVSLVLSDQELVALGRLDAVGYDLPKLAFSAKEAFYKAYYQQVACWLDFLDVAVTFDLQRQTFWITMASNSPPGPEALRSFAGRYAVSAQRMYCAIALPDLAIRAT